MVYRFGRNTLFSHIYSTSSLYHLCLLLDHFPYFHKENTYAMVEPKTSGNVSNLSVARLSSLNGVPNVRYYDPGTDEFICVAAAVVLAVDMLQSPTGRNNLESNGRDIVTEYQSKAKIMTEDLDVSQMTDYVNDFLRKIRQNFPYIVLKDLRWSRGQTTKETWGQENEDKYNTQNAAIMELNIVVSRPTCWACVYLTEQSSYRGSQEPSGRTKIP